MQLIERHASQNLFLQNEKKEAMKWITEISGWHIMVEHGSKAGDCERKDL